MRIYTVISAAAALASMTAGPAIAAFRRNDYVDDIGPSRPTHTRGKLKPRRHGAKLKRNLSIVSKRVRRKHRRAS